MHKELFERLVESIENFKHCEDVLEPVAGGQLIDELVITNPKLLQEGRWNARQRTLDAIRQWEEVDERLEALCKELGIEKPVLVI